MTKVQAAIHVRIREGNKILILLTELLPTSLFLLYRDEGSVMTLAGT